MYIAHIILITVPLFFSHIFSRFEIIFSDGSSFERMKVYIFLGLVLIFLFETIFFRFDRLMKLLEKHGWILFILFIVPLVSSFLSGDISHSIIGTHEKHHGYLWWVGLVLWGVLVSTLDNPKSLIRTSIYTASCVATLGILEYLGLSLVPSLGTRVWGDEMRIISTLGNPNYLAGYLLIHMPLVSHIRHISYRYFPLFLLTLGIILTGSYIGIGLMVVYGCIFLMRRFLRYGASFMILGALFFSIMTWQILPDEKKLSFETRGVLMRETIMRYTDEPYKMLIGYGPDSIVTLYRNTRSEVIRAYVPDTHTIDSSHSILIDLLYSYGVIIFGMIVYLLVKKYSVLEIPVRDGLMLGIVFFSLNVIVIAPLIVMILLALSSKKN